MRRKSYGTYDLTVGVRQGVNSRAPFEITLDARSYPDDPLLLALTPETARALARRLTAFAKVAKG